MRLIDTYRAYRALTPEQRRLLKEKRVEDERTPAQWIGLLAGLAAYDRQADAVRPWATAALIIAPVLIFFGAFFGSIALGYEALAAPLALGLALVTVAPLIVLFLALRSTNLAKQLREVAIPLVALIGEDLGAQARVRLGLDLRGAAVKPKLRETLPARQEGRRSVRERVFLDPWMTGAAVLNSGARLRWRLTDQVREYRISRPNPRGKIKTKTKFRVDSLTQVALDLPSARYRLRQSRTHAGTRVEVLEQWIKLRGRRRTRQKATQPHSAPLNEVLKAITGLYARAEPIPKQERSHV